LKISINGEMHGENQRVTDRPYGVTSDYFKLNFSYFEN